jgi:hypothetical protein
MTIAKHVRNPRIQVLLAASLSLSACDLPTHPNDPISAVATQQRSPAQRIENAYEITASANGRFQPGEPISITVRVSARRDKFATRITLTAPEVESARLSSWDDNWKMELNQPLHPFATFDRVMRGGQTIVEHSEIVISKPGVYQVIARVHDASTDAHMDAGQYLDTYRLWLVVDDRGGRVSEVYDSTLYSPGVMRRPGPTRKVSGDVRGTSAGRMSVSASTIGTSEFWSVYYIDYSTVDLVARPLEGVIVNVDYYENVYGSWVLHPGSAGGNTDQNGVVEINCPPYDDMQYSGDVKYGSSILANEIVSSGPSGSGGNYCGYNTYSDPYSIYLDGPTVTIFRNMTIAYNQAVALFGRTASKVHLDRQYDSGKSWYQLYNGPEINLDDDDVEGPHGVRVQAHELGHHYHEKALGGISHIYDACGIVDLGSHTVNVAENGKCAYLEGFAHFFAAVTRGAMGDARFDIPTGYPVSQGYAIENSFASFLYDLFDSDNSEPYDAVTISAATIGNVISTCSKQVLQSGPMTHASGIVYCFEGGAFGSWLPDDYMPYTYSTPYGVSSAQTHTLARYHLTGVYP